jgi:uncharacterized protein (DUF2062 family)
MPRHLIKRYAPDPKALKKHKYLRHLGTLLHDENLWHLNRRSVAGGIAAGLFWAMIPIPIQMVTAAFSAVFFRVNLPISVALVWLTNPITMPAVFYFNYLVGNWLLGSPPDAGQFQPSLEWFSREIGAIWAPLYLGSLVLGTLLAGLGYGLMRIYWRWHVLKRFRARIGRRPQPKPDPRSDADGHRAASAHDACATPDRDRG